MVEEVHMSYKIKSAVALSPGELFKPRRENGITAMTRVWAKVKAVHGLTGSTTVVVETFEHGDLALPMYHPCDTRHGNE